MNTPLDADHPHNYNTQRPHQGLPGRITPLTAWQATAKAEAPRPTRERLTRPPTPLPAPPPLPTDLPADTRVKKLTSQGTFYLDKVHYKVGGRHGLEHVLVITHADNITVTDLQGEVLAEHTRPAPGITYVSKGLPRGPHPDNPATSPKS